MGSVFKRHAGHAVSLYSITLCANAALTVVIFCWAVVILQGVLLHVVYAAVHGQVTAGILSKDRGLGQVHASRVPG